jgi:5-methylcytosine-specific restriction endonuclease McrA
VAADLLGHAVEALEAPIELGLSAKARRAWESYRRERAAAYARACDWTAFEWFWWEGGNEWERRRDASLNRDYVGAKAPATIPTSLKRAVAHRDFFTCRYCQLRVISPATMTALERALPAVLPIGDRDVDCHSMQCVSRLTWDHVTPRARGGKNTEDNIVTACGGCNYNKGSCSIDELSLRSPFDRDPVPGWDGLNGRLGTKPL